MYPRKPSTSDEKTVSTSPKGGFIFAQADEAFPPSDFGFLLNSLKLNDEIFQLRMKLNAFKQGREHSQKVVFILDFLVAIGLYAGKLSRSQLVAHHMDVINAIFQAKDLLAKFKFDIYSDKDEAVLKDIDVIIPNMYDNFKKLNEANKPHRKFYVFEEVVCPAKTAAAPSEATVVSDVVMWASSFQVKQRKIRFAPAEHKSGTPEGDIQFRFDNLLKDPAVGPHIEKISNTNDVSGSVTYYLYSDDKNGVCFLAENAKEFLKLYDTHVTALAARPALK